MTLPLSNSSGSKASATPASVVSTPRHSAEELVGQMIDNKYRVDRIIGMGGMGVVVAATQMKLDRLVAIKLVRQDLADDADAVERLLLEARAAARIRNEHVADVLDFGTLPGGAPFIVMEYLEGNDLAKVLSRNGPMPIPEAVDLLLQACEAVGEAHFNGIVHRDLKPGNLFVARLLGGSPCLKVVDFGISKQVKVGTLEAAMTTSPRILGTPNYMAPEQMRGHASGPKADIWALGAILFEMLTGKQAFKADTLPRLCHKVLAGRAPHLRQFMPDAPEKLERIIACCLSKQLDERYSDIAQLARKLAPFGQRRARLSLEHILAMTEVTFLENTESEDALAARKPYSEPIRPLDPGVQPRATSTRSASLNNAALFPGARTDLATVPPCSADSPPPSSEDDYADGPPSSLPPPSSTSPLPASRLVVDGQFTDSLTPEGQLSDSAFSGTSGDAGHSRTIYDSLSARRGWLAAVAAIALFTTGVLLSYFQDEAPLPTAKKPRPVTDRSGLRPAPAIDESSNTTGGSGQRSPVVRLVHDEPHNKPGNEPVAKLLEPAPASQKTVTAPSRTAEEPSAARIEPPATRPAEPPAIAPTTPAAESTANSIKSAPLDAPTATGSKAFVVGSKPAKPIATEASPAGRNTPEPDSSPGDPWNKKNFGSRL